MFPLPPFVSPASLFSTMIAPAPGEALQALVLANVRFDGLTAHAQDPVYFECPNLKAAVEDQLWIWDPTPSDMLVLTWFNAPSSGIGAACARAFAREGSRLLLAARRAGVQGDVVLECVIDVYGHVAEATVVSGSPPSE